MLQCVLPDNTSLSVVVLRRTRKTIGIQLKDGHVELVAHPRVSLITLQRVLDKERPWIWRHWQQQQAVQKDRAQLPQTFCLQGWAVPIVHLSEAPAGAVWTGDQLCVGGTDETLREQVGEFLFCQAAEQFPRHLRQWAPLAVRMPGPLLLSRARTRWGSCHPDGRIRLNWRLIQAPVSILDYVIAHELAHLRYMDHSPAFWQETARLYPDWWAARTWLGQHGGRLFDFG